MSAIFLGGRARRSARGAFGSKVCHGAHAVRRPTIGRHKIFALGCILSFGIPFFDYAVLAVDLLQPPAKLSADAPKLSPLLQTKDGQAITSKKDWQPRREEIKTAWLNVLGGLPKKKPPLKTELLVTETLPGFTRKFLRYQVEDDLYTDGYLLEPKTNSDKLPAIVVFHPTTPFQARGVAGLEKDYAEEKWQGVQLVQRGYVVWCPRNYINTDKPDWPGNAKRVLAKHPHWTGMTRMVWDAIRAADFLESLPNVDATRIGCIGHSLGGKEALFAPAFDERYKVSVSCEGGIGLKFSNWDAIWYLGDKIKKPDFNLENHEVLALVAPRAFLLLAGDSADNDKSWTFIQAVKAVYDLLAAPKNIGWFNHHLGHRYAPEARAVAEKFLDAHLKNSQH